MSEAVERAIDQFYVEVGRRVRGARGKRTQAQLAIQLGMTRSTIANLEAGRQRIPLHLLTWIAELLDVPVGQLLPEGPSFTGELTPLGSLDLSDEPESTRDFIEGAIAQLRLRPAKEA